MCLIPVTGGLVHVCNRVFTSSCSAAAALGACMCRFQQLVRLGSQDSYWDDWVSELSCWRDPHCPDGCVCISGLTDLYPDQTQREVEWRHWCYVHVDALCVYLWLAWLPVCILYLCCIYLFLCVPMGNICSASLLVRGGDMELKQSLLCWATRFNSYLT